MRATKKNWQQNQAEENPKMFLKLNILQNLNSS